jgi:hypothetical protein
MNSTYLYLAVPVLGEFTNLETFLTDIERQSYQNFHIYICVNQFDSWWSDPGKEHYCHDNARSLTFLTSLENDKLTVIDRSSQGKGWPDKKGGVGWARKVLMDKIAHEAGEGIIVSMDADTRYQEDYLQKIVQYFDENQEVTGLSVPYYHRLGNNETDRQILRYEIYMRYYALNMLRIKNPYNFTALGSALAIPLWAYRKIGGMTPVKSGEDFYLLQKLVKTGKLGQWVDTTAYPSARFSDRVLFGTGPAIIKGTGGDWSSYPLYQPEYFDMVEETYSLFEKLFETDMPTPMDSFLQEQFRNADIWKPLRENYKDRKNFIRACVNKVDGLRILQFLRSKHLSEKMNKDESVLKYFLMKYFAGKLDSELTAIPDDLDFEKTGIEELDKIRNFLFSEEMKLRKSYELS